MNYDRPFHYFNDYMDYRLNRKHHGALVRSILNKVELDRYRPYVSPFPRMSYSDYYYRPDLDRLYPLQWYDRSSVARTLDEPLYTAASARIWDSSLDDSYSNSYSNSYAMADTRAMRARSLERYSSPERVSVAREMSRARSLERDVPVYRNYVYPYYSYTAPTYYDYLSSSSYPSSSFFTYGPKSYYPPYTPYATYRHVFNPVAKRLNPEWNSYKPYEYRWRQFRYVLDPDPAYHGKKDLEVVKLTKAKEMDKWFKKREERVEERKADEEFLRKRREEREAGMVGSRLRKEDMLTPTYTRSSRLEVKPPKPPRDEVEEDLTIDLNRTPKSSLFKMDDVVKKEDKLSVPAATRTPPSTPQPEPADPEEDYEPEVEVEPQPPVQEEEEPAAAPIPVEEEEIKPTVTEKRKVSKKKSKDDQGANEHPGEYVELSGNWAQPAAAAPAAASSIAAPAISDSIDQDMTADDDQAASLPEDSTAGVAEQYSFTDEDPAPTHEEATYEQEQSMDEQPQIPAAAAAEEEEEKQQQEEIMEEAELITEKEESVEPEEEAPYVLPASIDDVVEPLNGHQEEDQTDVMSSGNDEMSEEMKTIRMVSKDNTEDLNGNETYEETTVRKSTSGQRITDESMEDEEIEESDSPRLMVAKSTGQTLVEERDLGEDECVRLEYQVEEVQMDGTAEATTLENEE